MLLWCSLAGAWPAAPDTNLVICDRTGEETVPKIATTSDGGCYVAWYDHASGNYDVYMQRLDPEGNPVWAHNGMLISNHTQASWLTDWDLGVDSTNSAIAVFNDTRTDPNWDIYAYRISPDGEFLWGADGIALSEEGNSDFEAIPCVAILNSGNVLIAWQGVGSNGYSDVKIRQLTLEGTDVWNPSTLSITSTYGNNYPHIVPADNDGFITSYVVKQGTSMYSPRHIYMQKYDASGVAQWTAGGVPVYVGSGVGMVEEPFLLADSLNGAYCTWHDSRQGTTAQHTWAQHILADGTVAWTVNGVQADMNAGRMQMDPTASRVTGLQDLILFYLETDPNQTVFSIGYQRVSSAGARLWTNNGILYAPLDSRQELNLSSFALGDGAVAVFAQYLAGSAVNSDVEAIRVDGNGANVWTTSPVIMCSVPSEKQRMAAAENVFGQVIATWPDGRIDPSWDIYLQNINPDGSLGNLPVVTAPQELTVTLNGDDIVLTWQAVDDATSYNVYASQDPDNFTDIIATATDTTATLVGESLNHDIHFYMVTAVR
ncbi:MAG: hypothetical protein V1784_11125 [bacterium]